MQLEFKSTPLTYLQSRLRQAYNQEQTLELRLPEGMPDLSRILVTGGQARLSAKQWRSDSVSLSGGVQAWAVYVPEDGSLPRVVEGWIPFQGKWNLPEGCREGILDTHITLRNLDGRILSPRKLMLRASAALCVEALCPQEIAVHSPEEVPQDIYLLQNSYPLRLCREAGEKLLTMEDTLQTENTIPSELLCCRATPRLTEQAVTGDRLVLRGIVDIFYLGVEGEAGLRSGHLELPFAQLVELDGEYDKEWKCVVSDDKCVTFEEDVECETFQLTTSERKPHVIQLDTVAKVFESKLPLQVENGIPFLEMDGKWVCSDTTDEDRLVANVRKYKKESYVYALVGILLIIAHFVDRKYFGFMTQLPMFLVMGIFSISSGGFTMVRLYMELRDMGRKLDWLLRPEDLKK